MYQGVPPNVAGIPEPTGASLIAILAGGAMMMRCRHSRRAA
jgi:hypothetical protein